MWSSRVLSASWTLVSAPLSIPLNAAVLVSMSAAESEGMTVIGTGKLALTGELPPNLKAKVPPVLGVGVP